MRHIRLCCENMGLFCGNILLFGAVIEDSCENCLHVGVVLWKLRDLILVIRLLALFGLLDFVI